jgi:hypothetical protein
MAKRGFLGVLFMRKRRNLNQADLLPRQSLRVKASPASIKRSYFNAILAQQRICQIINRSQGKDHGGRWFEKINGLIRPLVKISAGENRQLSVTASLSGSVFNFGSVESSSLSADVFFADRAGKYF